MDPARACFNIVEHRISNHEHLENCPVSQQWLKMLYTHYLGVTHHTNDFVLYAGLFLTAPEILTCIRLYGAVID